MGTEWRLINIDDLTPPTVWKLHVYSFACDNSLIRCVHKGSICAGKGGDEKWRPDLWKWLMLTPYRHNKIRIWHLVPLDRGCCNLWLTSLNTLLKWNTLIKLSLVYVQSSALALTCFFLNIFKGAKSVPCETVRQVPPHCYIHTPLLLLIVKYR